MKLQKYFLLILQLVSALPILYSQSVNNNSNPVQFRQITIEEGLPSNRVYNVVEDQLGFEWIATSEGLCRYDGAKFKTFRNVPNDPTSLSQNHVRTVFTDSQGRIWVGTLSEGVCVYDYSKGQFVKFKNDTKNPNSLVGNNILCFFEDNDKNIWIGTEQGVSVYNTKNHTFKSYKNDLTNTASIGKGGIICIAEDSQHRIWLSTWEGGLNLFIPKSKGMGTFRRFYPFHYKHFWSLYLDSKKRLWVGSFDGGLLLMKTDDTQSVENLEPQFINFPHDPQNAHSLSKNQIFDIKEDNVGKLWIATTYGLNVIDPSVFQLETMGFEALQKQQKNIRFEKYNYEYKNSFSIPSHEVYALSKGKNGIMWACTSSGLALFNPQKRTFESRIINENGVKKFINALSVVKEPNGRIWYGTENDGIHIFNPSTNTYQALDAIAPHCKALGGNIGMFYLENDKTLWIGCRAGLVRMNLGDYSYKIIISKAYFNNSLFNSKGILKDKKGAIWYATTEGVFRYEPSTSKIDFLHNIPGNPNSLGHNDASGIIEDDGGNIWLASYGGLDKITYDSERKTYTIINHQNDPNNQNSIPSNRILGICKKGSDIFIGTEVGLSKTDGNGKFVTYDKNIGEMFIKSLIDGEGDYIWGASSSGLFRFNIKDENFHLFELADGIHDNFFANGAAFKTEDKEIFFCGRMGATSFYEKDININDKSSDLYLVNVLINNANKKFESDASLVKSIILSYDENNITFEFAALNYLKPKSTKYAYKLEGYDKDWIYTGNLNTAVYTNLSGGDYVFKVKCSNGNGEWVNADILAVPLHLAKPFWEQTWFGILILGLVCLGVYGYIQFRTRSIRERNSTLQLYNNALNKEIDERIKAEESLLKTNEELMRSNQDLEQFAYIASHDLQEPLRMVGNFVQLLKRRYASLIDDDGRTYIGYAVEGVSRMSELIQNVLKFSSVGKSDIILCNSCLKKTVLDVVSQLQSKIKEKNIELIINDLPENINCESSQIALVFENLLINAIKFNTNPKPQIVIESKELADFWQFSIIDNGIGIKTEYQEKVFEIFKRLNTRDKYEGNGIGLAICKRVIFRHGGNIWLESEFGIGTTFHFTISKNIEETQKGVSENISIEPFLKRA